MNLLYYDIYKDLDEKLNFIGQKIMPLEKANSVNQKKMLRICVRSCGEIIKS